MKGTPAHIPAKRKAEAENVNPSELLSTLEAALAIQKKMDIEKLMKEIGAADGVPLIALLRSIGAGDKVEQYDRDICIPSSLISDFPAFQKKLSSLSSVGRTFRTTLEDDRIKINISEYSKKELPQCDFFNPLAIRLNKINREAASAAQREKKSSNIDSLEMTPSFSLSQRPPSLEARENENSQRKIIILAGPGGTAFKKKTIQDINDALKTDNNNVICVGDGESDLTDNEMDAFFKEISPGNIKITVFLQCHGEILNTAHMLCLAKSKSIKSEEFFLRLAAKLAGKPIDIFSTACYGNHAKSSAQSILPAGSSYVGLSDEVTSGTDVERFVVALIKSHHLKIERSAEQLLMFYLTNALSERYCPTVYSDKSKKYLREKFSAHLGKNFSESESGLIYKHLNSFVDENRLRHVMTKIESAKDDSSIGAAEYGVALAICHAASGDILQSLNQESISPSLKDKRKRTISPSFNYQHNKSDLGSKMDEHGRRFSARVRLR